MSVPVGSDPPRACCSSQIYLGFLQTLTMHSNISSPIWLGWTRTGDDTEPHQDSQPLKLEDRSLTALRTDRAPSRSEVVQFTGSQTYTFYWPI